MPDTMNYVPTQHSTGEDKRKFARQFMEFVQSDFAWHCFPKWFYTRLSMTFGHIAHYNRHLFYEEFFTTSQGKDEFLRKTLSHPCYGNPAYTYSDVEKELQKWLRQNIVQAS